jgi:phage FluMu protein Com
MHYVNHEVSCEEARCDCGHLVARLLTAGVELKCKRCKRLVVIPYTAGESTTSQGASLSR